MKSRNRMLLLIILIVLSCNAHSQSVITQQKDSTVTISKSVAINVLKDLNAYDGLKKEVVVYKQTDSLQQSRIHYKDSIIYTYQKEVTNYDSVVSSFNTEKILLQKQNEIAIKNYKLEKIKNTVTKIVSGIIFFILIIIKK